MTSIQVKPKPPLPAAYRNRQADCVVVFLMRDGKQAPDKPQAMRTHPMPFETASSFANRLAPNCQCVVATVTGGILDGLPEAPLSKFVVAKLLKRPVKRRSNWYETKLKGCYIN